MPRITRKPATPAKMNRGVMKLAEWLTDIQLLYTKKDLNDSERKILEELEQRLKETNETGESSSKPAEGIQTRPRRSARLGNKQNDIQKVPDFQQESLNLDIPLNEFEMERMERKKRRKLSIETISSKKSRGESEDGDQESQLSDSLVPTYRKKKQCAYCHTHSTPMWRHGPTNFPLLCNSCGVKFKRGRILQEETQKEIISIPSPAPTASPVEVKRFEFPISEPEIPIVPDIEPEELEKSFHELFESDMVSESNMEPTMDEDALEKPKFYPCARLIPLKEFRARKKSPTPLPYVSDFQRPLPVKIPSIYSFTHDVSSYYPAPENIEEAQERHDYLAEKMASISSEKLAQLLCILDQGTRNELIRAIKYRKDVQLDVSSLSNSTWVQICELFGH